jgi:hypothetical protein
MSQVGYEKNMWKWRETKKIAERYTDIEYENFFGGL